MVNVKNLFGMAVMASALVACSSNDDVNPNPNPQGGEVAYAAFKINLPTVSGTRAASDVEYNGGSEGEYNVNDATFLIFKNNGEVEANYTFVESSTVNLSGNWTSESGGVTTSKKLVAKLNGVSDGGKYSVLVVLNKPADFVMPTVGETYGKWNNTVLTPSSVSAWSTSNKFYMANATLLKGSASQTLTPIESNNIYPTQAKAEAGSSSADVYVERGVAKVTIEKPTANLDVKDKATKSNNGDKVDFKNWTLDVTNKKTYAVHNVTGLTTGWSDIWSSARMIGSQDRVFWGIDPNYSNNDLKDNSKDVDRQNNFNFVADADVTTGFGVENPLYCFENTFNIANMYQGQTTRVVFKANYTATGHADTDGTFYRLGTAAVNLTSTELTAIIEDAAKAELGTAYKSVNLGNINTEGGVHFVELSNITALNSESTEETLVAGNTYNGKTGSTIIDAINTRLGLTKATRTEDNVGINTYAKGVTYYIARIRHFSDTYCPWTSGQGYDTDANFLGRYGMLRNNWYEMKIGDVYGPGYPSVPPTDPDQPDDENEKYLSVSVKILDWAKRSQTVDL